MQHTPAPQDKRTPTGNNPLNTDFQPGGEDEKWPEDPQTELFETENDPDAPREDPYSDQEEIEDIDSEWESVIMDYKIY